MIEAVGKSEIESKLQANTRKAFDEFFRCSTCGKIYWKGSHYEKMYEMIWHFVFSGLDKEELMQLAPFITEEVISRSQFVFLEEEKAKHFYILREGNLRAFIGGKMLTAIKPGQIFGRLPCSMAIYVPGAFLRPKTAK
jgi:CRP-like cAMP-binding protein